MTPSRVLVADADLPLGQSLIAALQQAGVEVVCGARNQVRLAQLSGGASGLHLTVPVGDATDAEMLFATVEDAVGPLDGVVVPVPLVAGKVGKRVVPVADAMALTEGLATAASAAGKAVWVVGPAASAVVAFVQVGLPTAGDLHARTDASDLLAGFQGPSASTSRRRERWAARARNVVRRVLDEGGG